MKRIGSLFISLLLTINILSLNIAYANDLSIEINVDESYDYSTILSEYEYDKIDYEIENVDICQFRDLKIYAIAVGSTNITINLYLNDDYINQLKYRIIVKDNQINEAIPTPDNNIFQLKITNKNKTVIVGTNSYKIISNTERPLKYYSSNNSIATVSDTGYVKGLKKGTVTITIKTSDNLSASIIINVKNAQLSLNAKSEQLSLDKSNIKLVIYGKSYQNRALEGFEITNPKVKYKKTLFFDFAIHGFEDESYRDGKYLTKEANALIEYFAKHPNELKDCRLIIVPCVNPDGVIAGKNNSFAGKNSFGRCTANHLDLNRNNFGGKNAIEGKALKSYIKKSKPSVYLNFHGWLNKSYGNPQLCKLVKNKLSLNKCSKNPEYFDGYAYSVIHNELNIPTCLVEYKSSKSISTKKDIALIKLLPQFVCKHKYKTIVTKAPTSKENGILTKTCIYCNHKTKTSISKINNTSILSISSVNSNLLLKYKDVKGVSGYQIQYSTNKNFKSSKYQFREKGNGNAKINALSKNKRYYFRIRSYRIVNNKKYFSNWSPKKSIFIK